MATIVLVDDDRDFTSLVSELLRQGGWDVVVCNEEARALECVREAGAHLAILDIRMSTRESGWRILEELRSDPATLRLPVIVCSAALDDLRRRQEWLDQNGVSTLAKPFDIDDLLQLVERALADNGSNGAREIGTNGDTRNG